MLNVCFRAFVRSEHIYVYILKKKNILTIAARKIFQIFRGNSLRRVKNGTNWRAKDIPLDVKPTSSRNSANLSTTEMSPSLIAQANWTFVERLLKVRKDTQF